MLLSVTLALLAARPQEAPPEPLPPFDELAVATAAEVVGATFTVEELELMLPDVLERLRGFERLRGVPLANDVAPALLFTPGFELPRSPQPAPRPLEILGQEGVRRPADLEELAYADIVQLASLIRDRTVSCEELTRMYLARLRRIDETLECVITFTEERALEQARLLDRELEEGRIRGPLHGIPWVAKDLLAVRGYPTTWGAAPFREQVLDTDATVVRRLDEAGAVLIAKVTLGALAWGDVWFGGKTRNPWNPEQGSSGSSAGSAATVVAGGAVFALGTETWGSIVSPADRCGATALRPTFGRVSRHGSMALAWSLDKIGPICRSARDAAFVFEVLHGADPLDPSAVSLPFRQQLPERTLRVGIPRGAIDEDGPHVRLLEELAGLGVELVDVDLPDYPVADMMIVLTAEAGAAFDTFSDGSEDDELVRQERDAWPNVFRHARLIPAVDYIRANRLRTLLIRDMNRVFENVDVVVHPSFAAGLLTTTNLSGHPTVVMPCGFREDGTPYSVSFTGALYDEGTVLGLASWWQEATSYDEARPPF